MVWRWMVLIYVWGELFERTPSAAILQFSRVLWLRAELNTPIRRSCGPSTLWIPRETCCAGSKLWSITRSMKSEVDLDERWRLQDVTGLGEPSLNFN